MATAPESHYVLDGILGNQTDLPVTEHATDTHGATLANFALFDFLGLQLSPRIRDLGKITLYRTGPKAEFASRYPSAGKLLTRRLNNDHENIHFYGTHAVDVNGELAKLDSDGYRPLRAPVR